MQQKTDMWYVTWYRKKNKENSLKDPGDGRIKVINMITRNERDYGEKEQLQLIVEVFKYIFTEKLQNIHYRRNWLKCKYF